MHNFEKLLFWQKSMRLTKNIYLVCAEIPHDERFGLISQMKRSAVSICSNIAEGAGRNTNGEFNQFLGIANGSSFELQTQLLLSKELNLLNKEKVDRLLEDLNEIQKMVYTFKQNLKQV